ncbi:MAG: hypothetical protein M3O26_15720 [Pseudomonadota bacterium]|nr:hypothetical protein [Pseudomonadota bacterium]
MSHLELRCNACRAIFDEAEAIDDEFCPECGSDSLFEREAFNLEEALRDERRQNTARDKRARAEQSMFEHFAMRLP